MKIDAAVTFTREMSLAILISRSNKYINLAFLGGSETFNKQFEYCHPGHESRSDKAARMTSVHSVKANGATTPARSVRLSGEQWFTRVASYQHVDVRLAKLRDAVKSGRRTTMRWKFSYDCARVGANPTRCTMSEIVPYAQATRWFVSRVQMRTATCGRCLAGKMPHEEHECRLQ